MEGPKVAHCIDCVFLDRTKRYDVAAPENPFFLCNLMPKPEVVWDRDAHWCGQFNDIDSPYGVYSRGYFKFPSQPRKYDR